MAKKATDKTEAAPATEAQKRDMLMQAVVASVEKAHGKGSMMSLAGTGDVYDFPYQISTGSIAMDNILGPAKRLKDGKCSASKKK